jgi:CDP-diacylglycerol pyrophosphatase
MTAMQKSLHCVTLICLCSLLAIGSLSWWHVASVQADVRNCQCETTSIPAMQAHRECSLCIEADKQPAYIEVFFLKDQNPTKPNRILALPRAHGPGSHPLSSLSADTRHVLWAAAITKAQETWGDAWAIAYNGEERRTQCHTHLHIGKLLPGQETGNFKVVNDASEIPAPTDGTGLWVHPVDGKLHVHLGQQVNEAVLMR